MHFHAVNAAAFSFRGSRERSALVCVRSPKKKNALFLSAVRSLVSALTASSYRCPGVLKVTLTTSSPPSMVDGAREAGAEVLRGGWRFGKRRKSEQGQVQQAPSRGRNITPFSKQHDGGGPSGRSTSTTLTPAPPLRQERDTLDKHDAPLFSTGRAHVWPAVGVTHLLAGETN